MSCSTGNQKSVYWSMPPTVTYYQGHSYRLYLARHVSKRVQLDHNDHYLINLHIDQRVIESESIAGRLTTKTLVHGRPTPAASDAFKYSRGISWGLCGNDGMLTWRQERIWILLPTRACSLFTTRQHCPVVGAWPLVVCVCPPDMSSHRLRKHNGVRAVYEPQTIPHF